MLELFPSPEIGLFGRRVRQARGHRVPVIVVTGFLGAGKTTLVKRFLATPQGRGSAVVVNEFGAAGIDDALLRSSADETVLLGNGCLCCNVRTDLQVALRRLVAERERGGVDFRRIVIETSGLAEPGPILRTFLTDRALGGEFHVEAVIAVVDAVNGARTLEDFAEARSQAMLADRLVIAKADLAEASTIAQLERQLRALNPRAEIVVAQGGVVDPRCFIDAAEHDRPSLLAEAAHSDGITSFVLREDAPVSWAWFSRAMETLIALRGADVLRAKGLVNVEGCRGPVVVQVVQHLAHPPIELASWPDQDRRTRVVFIMRGLAEAKVRALFDAVRELS